MLEHLLSPQVWLNILDGSSECHPKSILQEFKSCAVSIRFWLISFGEDITSKLNTDSQCTHRCPQKQ